MLLAASLCAPAYATQVVYKSPQDLGRDAELVVRGHVQDVESYWNPAHTKIFTRTRVSVDETYKGDARPTIDLVQMGGIVGNVKVTVHGTIAWRVGEEVLLFVEPYDAGRYQISGFFQGRFKIQRDAVTGSAYVDAPQVEGVGLLGAPAPERAKISAAARRITLEQFVDQALGRPGTPGVEK
jgi:hypothetical protein